MNKKRSYRLQPVGWVDALPARLNYTRFAAVVERARREVVRTMPDMAGMHVFAMSAEAFSPNGGRWGEFYHPAGPVVIYQLPYEVMPDQENYYRQIKAVIVHEFEHARGEGHIEPNLAHVARA
jgi:hypothetical protein